MPYARAADGLRIYFERFPPGEGSEQGPDARRPGTPPVLLVMGLGANGRVWAPIVRRLGASGYEVITFDNRGCGRSAAPWRPWTTRTMAADAVAVLEQARVRRAHVIGASLGGMVAQELALGYPQRVSTLILGCTTGGMPRVDLVPSRALLRVLEAALRSGLSTGTAEDRVVDFLRFSVSETFAADCRPGSEAWEAVAAMQEDPMTSRGFAQQMLASMRHSSWSRLNRLKMPVQVQHGSADRLMPLAAGRELARRIPGASFEVIEGAGHALGLERPDETFDHALAFIEAKSPLPA
jgi:3-oxoadipate enol-lactonase